MKEKIYYTCQFCSHTEPKWLGRCPECGRWNSFSQSAPAAGVQKQVPAGASIPLSAVKTDNAVRLDVNNEEINRVLGGGLMRGSSVLIGGAPGIGKSTLMLQLASGTLTKGRILYVSGEESAGQLRMRADRLKISNERVEILCSTDLNSILHVMDQVKPVLAIVDSIQTIYSSESGSVPGTVSQIKLCTHELNEYVKMRNNCLFLTGHVTKEGIIAGPKVIEHLVDTVLTFEGAGSDIRVIRASKNRFGSTEEIGIFQMTESGLTQVRNPAALFLEHREGALPSGVTVTPVYEGSRVLLVELQCLVVPAKGGISRVFSDKIDSRRVSRMAAVLEKHLKLPFSDLDIYVNVAGGIRIDEVGIDLALALALYSAKTNLSLSAQTAVAGEVSLAGEIRKISHITKRVKSSQDLGFSHFIGPLNTSGLPGQQKSEGLEPFYREVKNLKQAVMTVYG